MFHTDNISEETVQTLKLDLDLWLADVVKAGLLPSSSSGGPQPLAEHLNVMEEATVPELDVAQYELGETFTEYILGAETIRTQMHSGADLARLVKATGRRHHQLKLNKQPVAYARSLISEGGPAGEICQFLISNLAGSIQNAIRWIDEYEERDPEYASTQPAVRLLVVPSYNVYAFWIFRETLGESNVLIIAAPVWLTKLVRNRLLTTREFLEGFESMKPIEGLGF